MRREFRRKVSSLLLREGSGGRKVGGVRTALRKKERKKIVEA